MSIMVKLIFYENKTQTEIMRHSQVSLIFDTVSNFW